MGPSDQKDLQSHVLDPPQWSTILRVLSDIFYQGTPARKHDLSNSLGSFSTHGNILADVEERMALQDISGRSERSR